MAEHTEISWAHSTFNPWIGCTKVSPGCDNCYAATLDANRYSKTLDGGTKAIPVTHWGPGAPRHRTKTWDQPRRWDRLAAASGKPWRVFCASLADVFDNEAPEGARDDLFHLIRATPALTWMLLTKRIGNVPHMTRSLPPNVWLGITVVNQEEAERDIPKLLAIPNVVVRWLSCEPLLGWLDLRPWLVDCRPKSPRVDWVIVGGESGHAARPMEADWVHEIRNDCISHSVPFHFKQWGGVRPKSNGHMLDGLEHREFPIQRHEESA